MLLSPAKFTVLPKRFGPRQATISEHANLPFHFCQESQIQSIPAKSPMSIVIPNELKNYLNFSRFTNFLDSVFGIHGNSGKCFRSVCAKFMLKKGE